MENVKENFNNSARDYDGYIVQVIPGYKVMTNVLMEMLPFTGDAQLNILDVGIGTGNISFNILKKYPRARVMGIDIAEQMLEVARERLHEYTNRLELRQTDFSREAITGQFDAVVSGLAIHHLNAGQKRVFYKQIYEVLKPGGIFINRDVIKASSLQLNKTYEDLWYDFMVANMDKEKAEYYLGKHKEEDLPDTLEDQLMWLKEAGFSETECFWKFYNYAVFGGFK